MSATKAKAAANKTDAELIGITTKKDGDFSDWYQQVLKKGDMLDYYDVSGCYILKPWSYTVWQSIQSESRGVKSFQVRTPYCWSYSIL
jgi:prolyl-tRNA synthetase